MNRTRESGFSYRSPAEADATPVASESVVDRYSHFNGTYRSQGNLRVEGTLEGEIECAGTVTVAQEATVTARVHARNVVVVGSANGEIACQERFTVTSTGRMRGTVRAEILVVEEGASFEGQFQTGRDVAPADTSMESEASLPQMADFDAWSVPQTSGFDTWSASGSSDRPARADLFGDEFDDKFDDESRGFRHFTEPDDEDRLSEESSEDELKTRY